MLSLNELIKYPRTKHISGSNLQVGDEDLKTVSFDKLREKYLVVEEKIDGANSGISFAEDNKLLIQSRGHFLIGGTREKHFNLLKTWAMIHKTEFQRILGKRYIMYGEWMYAKHTVYYDLLPHYFMEFDIYDKQNQIFLSTKARQELLKENDFIHSVKVLYKGKINSFEKLKSFVNKSHFISSNIKDCLKKECEKNRLDFLKVQSETDLTGIMEGLYIKVENKNIVNERYKFVRQSFKTNIINSETHWLDRPIIENKLIGGISIFE